jgi:hypothetical protein
LAAPSPTRESHLDTIRRYGITLTLKCLAGSIKPQRLLYSLLTPPMPTNDPVDSVSSSLHQLYLGDAKIYRSTHVFVTMSPLQCHKYSSSDHLSHSNSEQNETLIAQIKASELFVLRYFDSISSPSLSEAQGIDRDYDPTNPSFRSLNATTSCYPVYESPVYESRQHVQLNPPTPFSSQNEAQEQTVICNQENIELKQIENSITSFNSPISQSSGRAASQSSEDAPFNNNGQGGASPWICDYPPEELKAKRQHKSVIPVPDFRRSLRKLHMIKRIGN